MSKSCTGIRTAHLKNEKGRVASPESVPIHLNVDIRGCFIHSLDARTVMRSGRALFKFNT